MAARLYVETNFMMAVATGREPEADALLAGPPATIRVAIPSLCFMESLSALEDETRRRNHFKGILDQQIGQNRRDLVSRHAMSLTHHLEQARTENRSLLRSIDARLFQALDRLAEVAEILEMTATTFRESRDEALVGDPTDNLILYCILCDARMHPSEDKAFVSGNVHDFDSRWDEEARRRIRAVLDGAGVRYFERVGAARGWLSSQGAP